MKFGAMAVAVAVLAGSVGEARAEWVSIKESAAQSFYLDTGSRIETAPGIYRAWAKTVFRNNPAVNEKQAYEEYNCQAGTVKTISVVVTVKSGALVTQTPETVDKVAPGSPAQAKMWLLCEAKKADPEEKK